MNGTLSGRPIEILLVEDNPGDVQLTREILKESKHQSNISVAEDGEQAMAFLRREGEFADAPRPDLVLLDLRLPKKDGSEVLAELNEEPDLRSIPVMILTGTEAERSLLESYSIPPSRYFRKPIDVNRFNTAVTQLGAFSKAPITMSPPEQQEQAQPVAAGSGSAKRWWWPFG